jgi:hypothetical protein
MTENYIPLNAKMEIDVHHPLVSELKSAKSEGLGLF